MASLGILALAAFETAKISIPTIVDGLRGRVDARVCDARLDSWSKRLLQQARVQIQCSGAEHIPKGEIFVVMSNHQSHYDIPIVFQATQLPVRMVAKTELFQIPVMGAGMRASGFVEVDRSSGRRAMSSLRAARKRLLADGTSIWIAPEGTRSRDGKLAPFKPGGFHLAIAASLRILPVSIDGSYRIHRSGDVTVHKGQKVRVTINAPVDPKEYGSRRLPALMERVRDIIAGPLPDSDRGPASRANNGA